MIRIGKKKCVGVIVLMLVIVSIIKSYSVNRMEQKIEYRYNPKLSFIKSDYKGNIMIKGMFCNGEKKDKAPLTNVIKWKLTTNPQKKEKKEDTFQLETVRDTSFISSNKEDDVIIWLGHASFFIRLNNVTYITDPNFSDLPISKRLVDPPYTIKELGVINYILISHVHYDHFDVASMESIIESNPDVEILGPLGLNKLLTKNKILKGIKYQEAGWYQSYDTNNNEISFLPAKHWSRRTLTDFNDILWGAFGIISNKHKMFFAGDTALDSKLFNEINDIYGGFNYCFIPIGAYSPQFLMQDEHVNPKEAIEVFNILQGEVFIPMHFGTYDLSDEPLGEPLRLLKDNANIQGISNKILDLPVGKPLYICSKL